MRTITALILLCIVTSNALRCYVGSGGQCMLGPDMKQCGDQEKCVCAKYKFSCSNDDQACTPQEQKKKVTKWAYAILGSTTCQQMRQAPTVYKNLLCCTKNKCNRPEKTLSCNHSK